jgi:hypothetical protein
MKFKCPMDADRALAAMEQREARERLMAAIAGLGERCRKLLALKLEGKSFAQIQAAFGVSSINTIYTWDFRCRQQLIESMRDREKSRMTQDEIRKLLGGYATDALTADERRILFEAALEDQDLFNALQNEDALRSCWPIR